MFHSCSDTLETSSSQFSGAYQLANHVAFNPNNDGLSIEKQSPPSITFCVCSSNVFVTTASYNDKHMSNSCSLKYSSATKSCKPMSDVGSIERFYSRLQWGSSRGLKLLSSTIAMEFYWQSHWHDFLNIANFIAYCTLGWFWSYDISIASVIRPSGFHQSFSTVR